LPAPSDGLGPCGRLGVVRRRLLRKEGGPGLLADDAIGLELPVGLELADGLVGAGAEDPVGLLGADVVAQLLEAPLHLPHLWALAPPLQRGAGGRRRRAGLARPRGPGPRGHVVSALRLERAV